MPHRCPLLLFIALGALLTLLAGEFSGMPALAENPAGTVIISEIAWSGTAGFPDDEWLELYNSGDDSIDLTGWSLSSSDGILDITLQGIIEAQGYFLLEQGDDSTVRDIAADQIYSGILQDSGAELELKNDEGRLIDTANLGNKYWPAGTFTPTFRSMERASPSSPDIPSQWLSNNMFDINGRDAMGMAINGTPRHANSFWQPAALLISEVYYDAAAPGTSGDEFVEICNPLTKTVSLCGYKIGDASAPGGGESMYRLTEDLLLADDACLIVAKNSEQFTAHFGFRPAVEMITGGENFSDDPAVDNLASYTTWATGAWALNNNGDEVILLGPADQIVDSIAYGEASYESLGLQPAIRAPKPYSLQRLFPQDSDDMAADFIALPPSPGEVFRLAESPPARAGIPLDDGMQAFLGDLHAFTSYSDGAGSPSAAFNLARQNGLHFLGLSDHAASLSEKRWTSLQAAAGDQSQEGAFIGWPGFMSSTSGGENTLIFNSSSSIPQEIAASLTIEEEKSWLLSHSDSIAIIAGGDDQEYPDYVRPFDHDLSPIFIGYEIAKGKWGEAAWDITGYLKHLFAGWRLAPIGGSGLHNSEWGSDIYLRTGLVTGELTPNNLLSALRARRSFATADPDLAMAFTLGDTWMGGEVAPAADMPLNVTAAGGHGEQLSLTVYENGLPLAAQDFSGTPANWSIAITPKPGSIIWIMGRQPDGDMIISSPVWISGSPATPEIVINELLPSPSGKDWDGNGQADAHDEWVELYNPGDSAADLTAWTLSDNRDHYDFPLGSRIEADGYLLVYRRESGITLANDGDALFLLKPDGQPADQYSYERNPGANITFCRLPDGDGEWLDDCSPTPGSPNEEQQAPGAKIMSIHQARQAKSGTKVKLQGHVTVPPGLFSARVFYIQDKTGGIRVYLPKDAKADLELGQKVEVIGKTGQYYHETQVRLEDLHDLSRLEAGLAPPAFPVPSGWLGEDYEGRLLQIEGQVASLEAKNRLYLDDGSGWARIYLDPQSHINLPAFEPGSKLKVVGVLSQYRTKATPDEGYRLLPRFNADLLAESIFFPSYLPETGAQPPP